PHCDPSVLLFFIERPPPTSPLFPYTTLFRSLRHPIQFGHLHRIGQILLAQRDRIHAELFGKLVDGLLEGETALGMAGRAERIRRSEEHTSELQVTDQSRMPSSA